MLINETPVLRKVRKLLELAKSGTEHEAASAAERAADLMREHGLSEAELRLTDTTKKAEPIIRTRATATAGDTKINAWKGALAHGIADANGCKMWWSGGGVVFLGRTSAVETADYLLTWLSGEVERLADRAWEGERAAYASYERPNGQTWKHSFRIGCATRIAQRLKARAAERPELKIVADYAPKFRRGVEVGRPKQLNRDAPGTALMVLQKDAEEVCDAYAKVARTFRRSYRGGTHSSRSGYDAGRDAGERVNLSSGPGLPAPTKRLS